MKRQLFKLKARSFNIGHISNTTTLNQLHENFQSSLIRYSYGEEIIVWESVLLKDIMGDTHMLFFDRNFVKN